MKRKALAIIFIIVIVLSIASWLVYNQIIELQNQKSELQSQINNLQNQNSYLHDRISQLLEQFGENYTSPVKITAFVWEGGWLPIVGVTLYHPVSVTVRNYAAVNISGLELDVTLINNYDGAQIGRSGGALIDFLQAGETRRVEAGALANVGANLADAECVVKLMSGNTTLDEWTEAIGQ